MNARSVWTVIGGGDAQTLLASERIFELYALLGSGDAKSFCIPGTSARAPYEKLSLPNIFIQCCQWFLYA